MTGRPRPERRWREEPFRVFFPLGLVLVWAGVLPWLLYSVSPEVGYRSVFHATTQIQAFLMSFAIGFLFTAIPHRTGTHPAAAWEMLAAALLLVATTALAWMGQVAMSQVAWILLILLVLAFVARRFSRARGTLRPPASFIWIPFSLLAGAAGAVATGVGASAGPGWWWLHLVGSRLVLQGMFTGLVLGVGSFFIPMVSEAVSPGEAGIRRSVGIHLALALILAGSFAFDALGLDRTDLERWGPVTRGLVALAVLLVYARIWLPLSLPGWNRRVIRFAAWMVPAGYLVVGAWPGLGKGGLHLTFVTGFALLAFSVATHVAAAHSGRADRVSDHPWQAPTLVFLLVAAAGFRILVDLDGRHFVLWLAAAAGSFLAGTLVWASLALPLLATRPRPRWA